MSAGVNTSSTFPKGSAVIVQLTTDAVDDPGLWMVVTYTDITGIAGYAKRGETPGKDSTVRLFPWAVVESVTLVPTSGE